MSQRATLREALEIWGRESDGISVVLPSELVLALIDELWDEPPLCGICDAPGVEPGDRCRTCGLTSPAALPHPDEPYAYEFGRDNGDGTYSVVIERGTMVQVSPRVYKYGKPRDPHPEHPVTPLYTRPQPERKAT